MISKNLYGLGVDNQLKDFDTQEKWNYYEEVKNKFHEQCFSRNFISYYSPSVRHMLNTYTRANLIIWTTRQYLTVNGIKINIIHRFWKTSHLFHMSMNLRILNFIIMSQYKTIIFILWKRKANCKAIRYIIFHYVSV